jgi:hypothetical protein
MAKTMKEIVKGLSEPLDIKDIDWRVGTANAKGVSILGYKDARVDMKRLDEVTGGMWQNEYHRDSKGVLQCGIGIKDPEGGEWIWKWSNGTESFAESEKGEYSDAFKRAGFMLGIGRELYDLPFIWVNFRDGESSKNIRPNNWVWGRTSEGKLACYELVNGKKVVRYSER